MRNIERLNNLLKESFINKDDGFKDFVTQA